MFTGTNIVHMVKLCVWLLVFMKGNLWQRDHLQYAYESLQKTGLVANTLVNTSHYKV
jgi:hypothetical protein